jgi:hypothetical protein
MSKANIKKTFLFALLVASLCASFAYAAPSGPKRKPRVIDLQEIQIEGHLQKPNAFYILNRSRVRTSTDLQDQHFLRKTVDVVREEPF